MKNIFKNDKNMYYTIIYKLNGNGYTQWKENESLKIEHICDIKYGHIDYYNNDLIQYISFLFHLQNNELNKYFKNQIDDCSIIDYGNDSDSWLTSNIQTYIRIVFNKVKN